MLNFVPFLDSITAFLPKVLLQHSALFFTICCLGFRALWVLYSAEKGRLRDLSHKEAVLGNDFKVAIIVPLFTESDALAIHDTLECFDAQSYPASLRSLNFIVHPEFKGHLKDLEHHDSVNIWKFEGTNPLHVKKSRLLQWGLEKIMANSPPDLFVMLQVRDLVKPDFLTQTVSNAYQHHIFQGYLAYQPFEEIEEESALSHSLGMQTRLHSRLKSSGRFHGGLAVLLQESGFAFKPSLVEQFPIEYRDGLGFAPWGIRLQRAGFDVHWFPSMITYKRYNPELFEHVAIQLEATFIGVFHLLGRLLQFASPRELEQRLASLPFNPFIGAMLALLMTGLSTSQQPEKTLEVSFLFLTLAFMYITYGLLQFLVGRVPFNEWKSSLGRMLSSAFLQVLVSPVAIVGLIFKGFTKILNISPPRIDSTNSIPHKKQNIKDYSSSLPYPNPNARSKASIHGKPLSANSALLTQYFNRLQRIELRYGSQVLEAQLRVHLHTQKLNETLYSLELRYKSQVFHTQAYLSFDDAFTELQQRLDAYTISIHTCGACAFFYTPPSQEGMLTQADPNALTLSKQGICLFNKEGQPHQPELDVPHHLLTQACEGFKTREHHERILRLWKQSLKHKVPV